MRLAAQGAYFCCRYKNRTDVIRAVGPDGKRVTANLVDWLAELPKDQMHVEMSVWLGKKVMVPCRLLAVRVPEDVKLVREMTLKARSERKGQKVSSDRLELCGWTVLVTNAPAGKLGFEQAFELYRLRWQIERLFRLWKETLKMDEWRTKKPLRIECEIYAKLIGALLTQRITAFGAWSDPMRSLAKCADVVAKSRW
jgi:IS4 transposase